MTPRENEILALVAAGHGNRQIADRHFLSTRTVENDVSAILAKPGAASCTEGTVVAKRLGIIPQVLLSNLSSAPVGCTP